jgi:hypothetical protein
VENWESDPPGRSGRASALSDDRALLGSLRPTFRRFLNRENNIFDKLNRGTAKCPFGHRSTGWSTGKVRTKRIRYPVIKKRKSPDKKAKNKKT